MFKRNIETKLHKWAENPYRKPLILRGARQVGKTTVVNQFAENFENFISINLEKEKTLIINSAKTCPVANSIDPAIKKVVNFIW
jgi:predicted AAA+ superfamily ATPase